MCTNLHNRRFITTYTSLRLLLLLFLLMPFWCNAKEFVLVIDAGHGGKDIGAPGTIINEKDVTLAVAKQFGKMVDDAFDDVKVVYTRDCDKFVSLDERANIANHANGNLFISIHNNSVDKKSKNRKTVNGASVYTLGLHRTEENLRVAMRENSVMTLESDYNTRYQGFNPNSTESYILFELNQNQHMAQSVALAQKIEEQLVEHAHRSYMGVRQAGFLVLLKSIMPSVLVELDFICNPTVEKYLASEKGQTEMSEALFNAFSAYKSDYDKAMALATGTVEPSTTLGNMNTESTSASSQEEVTDKIAQNDAVVYRVQILTHNKPLDQSSKFFKGLSPIWSYKDGKIWKFTYGEASTMAEANKILRQIRNKFPDAFVITTQGDHRIKL
ncbi:MAG: N-acetylmuramoyl-L-alanine amidase [Muribaculaceae bacterium]|nr:N-acetylmuramoyl-L-alanine amidase [Muribaculaceae bacterium]